MDELDLLLLGAWNRIGRVCREKRIRALRRSRRGFKGVLTRPMREWCLVVRAADTRINPTRCVIDDPGDYWQFKPHTVTLDGFLVRELTQPVQIPWPGVTYHEAARLCGREYKTIKNWIRRGVFQVDHYPKFKFGLTNKRGKGPRPNNRGSSGGRPFVWTPSPIDLNNFTGRPPHPVWGTLWQSLWQQFPEQFTQQVRREPRFVIKPGRGVPEFRGWTFICPGRLDHDLNHKGCGRRCTYLYAPQTVWTLAMAMGRQWLATDSICPRTADWRGSGTRAKVIP